VPRVIEPTDKLLDLIYDAATDEELWTAAFIEMADLTASQGGVMFGLDYRRRDVTFTFNGGMSEEHNRIFRERHFVNPFTAHMLHVPVGKFVQSAELMSMSELERTAFYDEVLRPQETAHNFMVSLAAKADFQAAFNFCRTERQGPFEADELKFLARVFPHLRRSLLLGSRLDSYKALQQAQFQVLDRLAIGMVLLDRAARVVFANAATRSMTADGGPLRLRNSLLTASRPTHTQRLEQLIQAALRQIPVATMKIPHPQDGRLLTVLASSTRSRDIDRFGGLGMRDVAAMLVVLDPAQPFDIPPERIMDAYGLTLAEARVALSAASGASVPETAQRLNISANTVKTHLRRVFAKTGATRQSELARLMALIGLVRGERDRV
jgi:DNA-binding CsgD family transcriptional regulator